MSHKKDANINWLTFNIISKHYQSAYHGDLFTVYAYSASNGQLPSLNRGRWLSLIKILVKCLTRQWLWPTISAYISRIAYLPHCTRLCYPERTASSFLNHMRRINFSLKIGFQSTEQQNHISNFLTKTKSRHKEIWLLTHSYSIRFCSFMSAQRAPCLYHISVHIILSFMHPRRL